MRRSRTSSTASPTATGYTFHERPAGRTDRDDRRVLRQWPQTYDLLLQRLGGDRILSEDRAAVPTHPSASRSAAASSPATVPGTAIRWVRSRSRASLTGVPPSSGALMPASLVSPVTPIAPRPAYSRRTLPPSAPTSWSRRSSASGRTKVAAFIFEPVVGCRRRGCVPAPPTYARRVREICDRYGVC